MYLNGQILTSQYAYLLLFFMLVEGFLFKKLGINSPLGNGETQQAGENVKASLKSY